MNCGLVEFIVGEWNRQPHWASGQKKLSAHPASTITRYWCIYRYLIFLIDIGTISFANNQAVLVSCNDHSTNQLLLLRLVSCITRLY